MGALIFTALHTIYVTTLFFLLFPLCHSSLLTSINLVAACCPLFLFLCFFCPQYTLECCLPHPPRTPRPCYVLRTQSLVAALCLVCYQAIVQGRPERYAAELVSSTVQIMLAVPSL